MSKNQRFDPPGGTIAVALGNEHLEVRLKLRLDEVACIEAEELRRAQLVAPTRHQLIRLATKIYEARRVRYRLLDRKLFGEPAWDMLLALYCLPPKGEILTITGLTHAAEASAGTGARWQAVLEQEELIERGPDLGDGRRHLVRLSAKGRSLMDAYLTRLFYADQPIPPMVQADHR